ncbi:NAD-dependent epimerase/dehydratase family protein, partial [Saccharothrix coeruleofusca]
MTAERVLVTGGRGYLGSVLTRELVRRGRQVVVLDNGAVAGPASEVDGVSRVDADVRVPADWEHVLAGVDAVVHLAAIVGDPACGVDPDDAWDVNYVGTVRVAEACRRNGVHRLVFASTCSNYGACREEADVWSPLNPQSVYARSKILAEHHLLSACCDGFSPQVLRLATLHGLSPRMRFDLAVNAMTADAVALGEVVVHGGDQWRPFLHVRDAARVVLRALDRRPGPGAHVYNCGSNDENYRMDQVGALIAREVPGAALRVERDVVDPRNYRVNFDRARRDLRFDTRNRVVDT